MTDKILVSRSEIEKLIIKEDKYGDWIYWDRLRALLDKAAISQAEPVAEVILDKMFLPALKVPLVDFKIDLKELPVGTKLFTSPPADKQDAERYRWLRPESFTRKLNVVNADIEPLNDRELDEAIDTAMKGE